MENTNYTIYEKVLSQRDDKETEFEETLPEYKKNKVKSLKTKISVIPMLKLVGEGCAESSLQKLLPEF